jgi:hypothetical protein
MYKLFFTALLLEIFSPSLCCFEAVVFVVGPTFERLDFVAVPSYIASE